jgi:hypothetical protein
VFSLTDRATFDSDLDTDSILTVSTVPRTAPRRSKPPDILSSCVLYSPPSKPDKESESFFSFDCKLLMALIAGLTLALISIDSLSVKFQLSGISLTPFDVWQVLNWWTMFRET